MHIHTLKYTNCSPAQPQLKKIMKDKINELFLSEKLPSPCCLFPAVFRQIKRTMETLSLGGVKIKKPISELNMSSHIANSCLGAANQKQSFVNSHAEMDATLVAIYMIAKRYVQTAQRGGLRIIYFCMLGGVSKTVQSIIGSVV